jgi:hypothetical protein
MLRIFFGASLVGAGAVAVACSSSSPSPAKTTGGSDAAEDTTTTTTVEDSGTEAAACVPAKVDVATFDSGSSSWSCLQGMCSASIVTCAADCSCNAAIYQALQCVVMAGAECAESSACTTNCFTTALTTIASDTAVGPLVTCLTADTAKCGGPVIDGGPEAGGHDGATGDSATGDSATVSDAPAEGG